MADTANSQKQDIVNIMKFSAQNEMGKADNARKILRYAQSNGMMTSPYGKQYIQRLAQISTGTDPTRCTCLFCKKNKAIDGILCDSCENKYSGGKLKIKQPMPVTTPSVATTQNNSNRTVTTTTSGSAMQKFADKIDVIAGGDGKAELNVKMLFSDVFKHHTSDEAEHIFICGTESTTPVMKDIRTDWPTPWLYSRVALTLFVAFVLLEISWDITGSTNVIPGMMVIGSIIVPFSVMIFFFEANAPQNISIFKTVQVFFIGGCASLLSTFIIYMILPGGTYGFFGAFMIGIIEEVGKMLIVAWYIGKMRDCQYILNGMLIGSAVGAGFAAFESSGYAFNVLMRYGSIDAMVENINTRAMLAPGGHVAWAAVTGGAIMIALSDKRFSWDFLKDKRFLRLFAIMILLHGTWDTPIANYYIWGILIVIVWVILIVLIKNGLNEVDRSIYRR